MLGPLVGLGLSVAGTFGCAHSVPERAPVGPAALVAPSSAVPAPAVRTVPPSLPHGPLEPVGPFTLSESDRRVWIIIDPIAPCSLEAPMLVLNGLVAPCWAAIETIERIDPERTVRLTFYRGTRATVRFGSRAGRHGGVLWVVTSPSP
jgi:hypothetical protein